MWMVSADVDKQGGGISSTNSGAMIILNGIICGQRAPWVTHHREKQPVTGFSREKQPVTGLNSHVN